MLLRRFITNDCAKAWRVLSATAEDLFLICFRCNMTLSSWTLDNRRLNLYIDGSDNFEFSIFSESNEWMLADSSAWKSNERYSCGHTEAMEFTQLTYSMTIRRRVGFYVYFLIVPSVLLSLLMPLTFWIPPTGDGRITIGNLLRWPLTIVKHMESEWFNCICVLGDTSICFLFVGLCFLCYMVLWVCLCLSVSRACFLCSCFLWA